jgi:ribosomal protein S18 acetylase RimI-like enzyme
MIKMEPSFIIANTIEQFADGRKIFEEYAASLNFDLCFQGFAEELDNLDKQYNAPTGALIVAYDGNIAIAAVGVRYFSEHTAELKRMYVKQNYRGFKIGRELLAQAINCAKELGYHKILLDTRPSMANAISLYRDFGFIDISPYRHNPYPDAIFMEKRLE